MQKKFFIFLILIACPIFISCNLQKNNITANLNAEEKNVQSNNKNSTEAKNDFVNSDSIPDISTDLNEIDNNQIDMIASLFENSEELKKSYLAKLIEEKVINQQAFIDVNFDPVKDDWAYLTGTATMKNNSDQTILFYSVEQQREDGSIETFYTSKDQKPIHPGENYIMICEASPLFLHSNKNTGNFDDILSSKTRIEYIMLGGERHMLEVNNFISSKSIELDGESITPWDNWNFQE